MGICTDKYIGIYRDIYGYIGIYRDVWYIKWCINGILCCFLRIAQVYKRCLGHNFSSRASIELILGRNLAPVLLSNVMQVSGPKYIKKGNTNAKTRKMLTSFELFSQTSEIFWGAAPGRVPG